MTLARMSSWKKTSRSRGRLEMGGERSTRWRIRRRFLEHLRQFAILLLLHVLPLHRVLCRRLRELLRWFQHREIYHCRSDRNHPAR